MGWSVQTAQGIQQVYVWPDTRTTTYITHGEKMVIHADGTALTVPPYSTDIAAAWQVLERMKENGWHYYVGDTLTDDHYARFHEFMDDDGDEGASSAPTAPLAICLAALKACGVDVEGV